ncbi:MAG TPA: ATP-dependent DNA helicase RecG [Bacteroidales bacterium]|nr:ATP-dependent DNA helicase RecG [Bacteroidales bacterium]HPS16008.1 ATP-dependent DNA helicase RecG [Bacteroidales bacterium]
MHITETPIEYLKGVGPQRAEILKKELGIFSFNDLIDYYPFRYIDKSRFYKVSEISSDMPYVQLKGFIDKINFISGGKKIIRMTARFRDETGAIELVWFNGFKWLKDNFKPNIEYIVFGKPTLFSGKYNIAHPDVELPSEQEALINSSLQAFYNSSEKLKSRGLDSKGISKLMKALLPQIKGYIPETLSQKLIEGLKLISREEALKQIHFPESQEMLQKAQLRLKFEELFFVQLRLLKLKLLRSEKFSGNKFSTVGNHFNDFYKNYLPFQLTNSQKKVIKEIRNDIGSGKQMNRLLQGDVGSGKTIVSLLCMLIALDNGFQACIMAPTEILAMQHFVSITKLLKETNINVQLLTGSTKKPQRKKILSELENGDLKILIGTHALLEENVKFLNLGFVVIDEQHRFGVAQRAKMWQKNNIPPHVLVMTATPIPRTLAMTLYGDLDVSVINELPPGRKPVKTVHFTEADRLRVFGFMRKQIHEGHQIYVVYPLIFESESLDLKHLMEGYDSIVREFPLPHYAISIVHGQMKTADKDFEMQRFVKGETNIMVATTVIEVGVDIPNASVMVIENAERFGLSQLHQLRGRVGRGADQSYCILMTGNKLTSDGKKRIETMVRTTDGFEIAEADLRLRGPGDITGTQQSGILDFKIADIIKDEKLLHYARKTAIEILEKDPTLSGIENIPIIRRLSELNKENVNWSRIS